MSQPTLVTGAAGGTQGSTGRLIANILLRQSIPVRALVHKLDSRSAELRQQGAEVVEGDLLNPASVQAAVRDVKRAYFTYPVADGLLEAATIFAAAARDAGLELVVNKSQYQGRPGDPAYRDLNRAASFRNLQHRLADRIFDWAQVGAVHLQAPPYYENVRALVSRSVAEQSTVFLPWGEDTTVIPLVGAQDVSRVAAALLANPGAPSQSAYTLVGATPTVGEMTEALRRAIGRPIRYVAITDEQWANAAQERLGAHALDHLSHLWQTFQKGEERYQTTDAIRMVPAGNPRSWRSSSARMPDCSPAIRRRPEMSSETIFSIQLILGYVACLLCFSVYVWPRLKAMDRFDAQRAIATLHSVRFFGLVFILPGVVGPDLPAGFATFAAYGDFATGILAILALLTARIRPLFWSFVIAFNLVGATDIIVDYYNAIQVGVPAMAGQLVLLCYKRTN